LVREQPWPHGSKGWSTPNLLDDDLEGNHDDAGAYARTSRGGALIAFDVEDLPDVNRVVRRTA
jgi:hypothetical protein